MTASLGTSLDRTERVTVRGATETLPAGILGMPAGTLLGPMPWGAPLEADDDATYASAERGAFGVLLHATAEGEPGTSQTQGRAPVRISKDVQRGQWLALDPAFPGHLHPDTTGTARPYALALADGLAFTTVRAKLVHLPTVQPDASGA